MIGPVKSYEEALEIDPAHEPSLGRWPSCSGRAETSRALPTPPEAHRTRSADARVFRCLGPAGQRHPADRLDDPYQAIDAYLQALKLRPDSLAVLEDLLALYRATKQGQKAVETLLRMLDQPEIQADVSRSGRPATSWGRCCATTSRTRYRLHVRKPRSLTLDADPSYVDAFGAIEALLTERQDGRRSNRPTMRC